MAPFLLTDRREGEGVGEKPNYTTAIKPSPLKIIQHSLVGIFEANVFLMYNTPEEVTIICTKEPSQSRKTRIINIQQILNLPDNVELASVRV